MSYLVALIVVRRFRATIIILAIAKAIATGEELPEPHHGKTVEPAIGEQLAFDDGLALVAGAGLNCLAE